MSKREPLLSDDEIHGHKLSKALYGEERVALEVGMRVGRSFYELLIDEGKLRVVEEVENKMANGGTYWFSCGSCGRNSDVSDANFCPGCGNKVRR